MTRAAFERLVSEAITLIPRRFRDEMRNIAIVVEDEPSPETLEAMDICRAFSSSAESETVVPSTTLPNRLMAPASNSSASLSEVLPLPRCPTRATLRIWSGDLWAI